MKFSQANNRDFIFYLRNRHNFRFCGTLSPNYEAIVSPKGVSGKDAFFSIENNGINKATKHPNLLNALLLTKASVNFHIKMWAENRADCTMPLWELSKKLFCERTGQTMEDIQDLKTGEWKVVNGEPVKILYNDIQEQFNMPDWVVKAVENQKVKFYKVAV